MKALLAAGADPNARELPALLWQTPLHYAVRIGQYPEVVKALLDAGADPSAKDKEGKTPVELVPDDSPLRGTDVYWRLNEARWR